MHCPLMTVDLNHPAFQRGGVYIIWLGGSAPVVVTVGQADPIGDKLREHRADQRIYSHAATGKRLFVTWAEVDGIQRNGVMQYLANILSPTEHQALDDDDSIPIRVNLPW